MEQVVPGTPLGYPYLTPQTRLGWKPLRLRNFDYSSGEQPYFITIRAKLDTSPFSDERLANAVIESLNWTREHRHVSIYAYCLMPDHLHFLLRLPEDGPPLGEVIGAFKRFTTRQSWGFGFQGAIWQSRYYDRILRKSEDARQIVEYIMANPVRRGLVENPEHYPWSGTPDPM
jgi:putative transposase